MVSLGLGLGSGLGLVGAFASCVYKPASRRRGPGLECILLMLSLARLAGPVGYTRSTTIDPRAAKSRRPGRRSRVTSDCVFFSAINNKSGFLCLFRWQKRLAGRSILGLFVTCELELEVSAPRWHTVWRSIQAPNRAAVPTQCLDNVLGCRPLALFTGCT